MPQPDLVIKLLAPLETLELRRPNFERDVIVRKLDAIAEFEIPGCSVVVLDASEPARAIVAQARQAILAKLPPASQAA